MSDPQPNGKRLQILLAGVLAHPETFAQVAEVIDDSLVASVGDPLATALWTYLSTNASPNYYEVYVALAIDGVEDAAQALDTLRLDAVEVVPAAIIRVAKKLARVLINSRRKYAVKEAIDASPLTTLDVETIANEAARNYPHTTPGIHVLTLADCEAATTENYTVIPTGFSYIDDRLMGLIVGEFQQLPGRTGDGKSSVSYAIVRNQFFANSAKHREDPWWAKHGAEWRQHGKCGRREALLRPIHAGHDHPDETYVAPRVLWFSLEEPQSQVLSRFYCDLLSINRQRWMTRKSYRANMLVTYAREIGHINNVLSSGRLTIVDYATRRASGFDEQAVEQTLSDVVKKTRAWARECARRDEAEGVVRPRLALIDYAQLINVPDDQARQEHAVLAKVSTTLRNIGPECNAAVLSTLMLLRDHEGNEPTKEQIKGSSQFAQDAARIITLWPFGKQECNLLNAARNNLDLDAGHNDSCSDSFDLDAELEKTEANDYGTEAANSKPANSKPEPLALVGDDYEASPSPSANADEDEGAYDDYPADGGIGLHLARAEAEMLLISEKDRFGAAGWRLPLAFTREFTRITEALPDVDDNAKLLYCKDGSPRYTSYREHPGVKAVVAPKKPRKKDS